MTTVRPYRHEEDTERVDAFLVRMTSADAPHHNWLQARWEYMHFHPMLDRDHLDRFGVWEEGGAIVAVVHYENRLGTVTVELDPRHASLKPDVLRYAQVNLAGTFKVGKAVHVYIDEADKEFESTAVSQGSERMDAGPSEPTSKLAIRKPFPPIRVPEGFRVQSLAEDDLRKVHRVLHRGFNHEGEPPEDGLEGRRRKLAAPGLRKDLTLVAVAPSGDFASFCGMWYDAVNRVASIEPVATDPDYRRQGLGTAVVLEGIRRCAALGAIAAYVGSDQPFHLAMGFEVCRRHRLWRKVLEPAPAGDEVS